MGVLLAASPAIVLADFAGHRAIYRLTLESAHPASGIASAKGELAVDWRHVCDGWTMEFRSFFDVTYRERGTLRLGSASTSWENVDGTEFRFNSRHTVNGKVMERIEGTATIQRANTGKVTLAGRSGKKTLTLPAGTLFPLAHARALIAAAQAGSGQAITLSRTIFDGMDENSVFLTNAIIGKEQKAGGEDTVRDLKLLRSWPVNMAYFRPNNSNPEPFYEYRVRLFDNGVADDLVMTFDDFQLRGKIDQLVLTKKQDC